MSELKERRCHACGTGRVRRLKRPGRHVPYWTLPALEIPASVAIPTCDSCGAEWIDRETARAIDAALEPLYQEELRRPQPHPRRPRGST
jgi:hypothetical protein